MLTAKPAWLYAVVGYIVVEVILVAFAVGWVAFYSYGVHPGEPNTYYQAYAQHASPIVALIGSIPVCVLTGSWFRRKLSDRAPATMMALVAINFVVMIVALSMNTENRAYHWTIGLICCLVQMIAGWFGSRRQLLAGSVS